MGTISIWQILAFALLLLVLSLMVIRGWAPPRPHVTKQVVQLRPNLFVATAFKFTVDMSKIWRSKAFLIEGRGWRAGEVYLCSRTMDDTHKVEASVVHVIYGQAYDLAKADANFDPEPFMWMEDPKNLSPYPGGLY